VKTKCLPFDPGVLAACCQHVFTQYPSQKRRKDHRYFSIVENHRITSDKTVQRTVLYLGEINDQQQATWRKTLSVFDDEQQEYANLSLFPDDREISADAVDSLGK
jgi:phytoene dehydrogenase-like protein